MTKELEEVFTSNNPSIEKLHREADSIQQYMEISAKIDDPAVLTFRLKDLDVYMARVSDMLIRSKAMRDKARNRYVSENEDYINKLSATVSNRKIDIFLEDYTILHARLDAMYGTIEHLAKDLVTQISYIKKQIEQFGA